MLLSGINHIAVISMDAQRLGNFYRTVFDAEVGPTRAHGSGETMTNIRVGPTTELNVFVITGNTEANRQTPMWGRGRIDHIVVCRRLPPKISKLCVPDSSRSAP